ncbi:MAG: signal peptidase I, partial [Eubacterium sp.]|nr:signal peptidase I [Eubacterium sp.]
MEPTISVGDTMLLDKAAYRLHSVRRGDIIAYRNTDNENEVLHVKRVVGLPGETIQIVNGQIVIDGETYREGRNLPTIIDAGIAAEPV